MKRRPFIRFFGMMGAASFFRLHAQTDEVTFHSGDVTFRNDVRLVVLDASVHDRRGKLVSGLSKDNFTVFENGIPQTITVFDNRDAPVTMGILVDESGSMIPNHGPVLSAALALVDESNRADEIFVLHFNDSVQWGLPEDVPFSGDRLTLRTALYQGVPRGKTALYDAIALGLKHLEAGTMGRKTLVVISDGGDNASTHTRRQTMDLVQRSTASIFTVGMFYEQDSDEDPALLKEFARIAGGEAWFPANNAGVIDACQHIAREIRARYTIGYIPNGDPKLPSLRRIHVRATAPGRGGLTVVTRTSYRYDQTPA